jgi:hypothetical protein
LLDGVLTLGGTVYAQPKRSAAQFFGTPEISTAGVLI